MTDKSVESQIQEQIRVLKIATEDATKSKEAANNYLKEAGIVAKEKDATFEVKEKK